MMKAKRSLRTRSVRTALLPYSLWAAVFILVPLGFVAYYALTDESFDWTLENLNRFFTSVSHIYEEDGTGRDVYTYLLILGRSFKLAVISALICLLIGYPLAYRIAHARRRTQNWMMTLLMIPMWTNFLIRTYAWMTILQDTGLMNSLLSKLGLPIVHVIGTEAAVLVGMVYDYLPYMVLPLYSVMLKMDGSLIEAARDLGCGSAAVVQRAS